MQTFDAETVKSGTISVYTQSILRTRCLIVRLTPRKWHLSFDLWLNARWVTQTTIGTYRSQAIAIAQPEPGCNADSETPTGCNKPRYNRKDFLWVTHWLKDRDADAIPEKLKFESVPRPYAESFFLGAAGPQGCLLLIAIVNKPEPGSPMGHQEKRPTAD